MGKVKELLGKAGNAFRNAMMLKDEDEDVLGMCQAAPDYIKLAIYDKGEIIVPISASDAFLDCVETFALIKSINGEPLGDLMMGLKVYSTNAVNYDLGRITELSTWQALVKNHFTDFLSGMEDNALRFALSSAYPIPAEVFDLLYAAYPKTQLKDILYDCKRLEATKWAVGHGADRFYDGFTDPMQKILSWTKRGPEAEPIYWFLYNEDPKDYGKEIIA